MTGMKRQLFLWMLASALFAGLCLTGAGIALTIHTGTAALIWSIVGVVGLIGFLFSVVMVQRVNRKGGTKFTIFDL